MGNKMGARIKVFGVGGAGNNVINRMRDYVQNVEFISINTDAQALDESSAPEKLHIGPKTTKGLGAGGDPNIGQEAAKESTDQIRDMLKDTDLVFVTAGMGGGTGTGASPIVAKIAHELGVLTVGVVTKPFVFEGRHRAKNAEIGISNLSKFVDCNIVVPNQKLVEGTGAETTMLDAFAIADDVLRKGVQCITDLITKNMTINVDFNDISNIMRGSGIAHMGIGEASGENRLLRAIQDAVQSPILETNIKDASQVILSITGGYDLKIHEVDGYVSLVKELLDDNVNMKFGVDIDPNFNDKIRVIIIATGFPRDDKTQMVYNPKPQPVAQHITATAQPKPAPHIVEGGLAAPKHDDDPSVPPYIRKMRENNR